MRLNEGIGLNKKLSGGFFKMLGLQIGFPNAKMF